jgi:hypothetical protein
MSFGSILVGRVASMSVTSLALSVRLVTHVAAARIGQRAHA